MLSRRPPTYPTTLRPASTSAAHLCLALLIALATSQLSAQVPTPQQPPDTQPDEHPYTLQVFTRLIQMPTLVLTHDRTELPPIDPHKFHISIDSGPRFRPTHIRREGDDPITLAILLDVSGDEDHILRALSRAFTSWVSTSLKPQDHISIYAVDCAMIQTAAYVPATSPTLQQDLDNAISSPKTHRSKANSTCRSPVHLWDAVAIAMQHISTLPGRRVLLVLSSGYSGNNSVRGSYIRYVATNSAVTIFGLTEPLAISFPEEIVFNYLVASSGGTYLGTSPKNLPAALANFITILRDRYILEFPTPANPTPGRHDIQVTIDHTDAFITTSGLTVALPDPAIEQNPLTIHNDNPDAPVIGNHKPTPNF